MSKNPEGLQPNVHLAASVVWNTQQIKDILDRLDTDNGLIRVEIEHGFVPGKTAYHVKLWRYPSLELIPGFDELPETLPNDLSTRKGKGHDVK